MRLEWAISWFKHKRILQSNVNGCSKVNQAIGYRLSAIGALSISKANSPKANSPKPIA